MPSLHLPLGNDPDSDQTAFIYTMPDGSVAFTLPDGWDGAWLTAGNARRLAEWLDEYAEV